MPPRRPPPDPPTDEEWDRRSLEGEDPDSGDVRHSSRRLHAHVETLVAMAESRERGKVLRAFVRRFIIATAALLAAMTMFREQFMSWVEAIRTWGQP